MSSLRHRAVLSRRSLVKCLLGFGSCTFTNYHHYVTPEFFSVLWRLLFVEEWRAKACVRKKHKPVRLYTYKKCSTVNFNLQVELRINFLVLFFN